jgi:hypothetical protein
MASLLLFAAHHQDNIVVVLIELVVCFILIIVSICMVIQEAGMTNHVNLRRGVPYCPRCNRQVSLRRGYCRSCDYGFRQKAPKRPPEPFMPPGLVPWLKKSWCSSKTGILALIRWLTRSWSLFFRNVVCFGWLSYLPGWVQPLVIGTGLSIPFVAVLAVILRRTLLDP